MLSKNLCKFNVRDFRMLFRQCFISANPNLKIEYNIQRNLSVSSRQTTFCNIIYKIPLSQAKIDAKSRHTLANDNLISEQCSENSFARKVLSNSEKAKTTIGVRFEPLKDVTDEDIQNLLSQDWEKKNVDEAMEGFQKLSSHAKLRLVSLEPQKHAAIFDAIRNKFSELSTKQLIGICNCLNLWTNVDEEKCLFYQQFWTALDAEFVKRFSELTTDEALIASDYLYQLDLTRKTKFPWFVVKKLGSRPNRMSSGNFLHFMFLLNICRKTPINMYEIEYRLNRMVNEFSADELGIVAMGFFKTQTSFRDQQIITKLHTKLVQEIDTVGDISISAIMKMTRYSMGLKDLGMFSMLLNSVKTRISELSIPCIVHIAHAAASVQFFNPQLLQLIIERFSDNIDQARLKDLERMSWILSIFDYKSDLPLYHKIVESLKDPNRAEELNRYPTLIPLTLLHLSHAGVFPIDLIQEIMSPEFLHRVYSNNAYRIDWHYFVLENSLKIEVPEYEGPFLKQSIREHLGKKYVAAWNQLKKSHDSFADKMVLEIAHMCKIVLGSDTAICFDQVLPHFVKPDIIFCLDSSNNLIAPEPILSKLPVGEIKRLPVEFKNFKWFTIIPATQNQIIRGTNRYTGQLHSKIGQLIKIGYTPIVIPFHDWFALQSLEAKENYIRNTLPNDIHRSKVAGVQ